MEMFIPVNEPLLDGNEKKYLLECIDTGWISSEGPFINKFEQQMASYVNRKYGIAVANGTAALDITIQALGITKGDEVILPSFTIISCATAIVRTGAIPVLIDADPITWNMQINQIQEKITNRTKAILIVHIYGLPVDMDPVLDIARRHNLFIIEDAAEMHGQTYKGNPCGSFGNLSTFSFYPNKHITTGEGGMIVTDDPKLAERCRSLRNLCFQEKKRYVHDEIGWNYRMSNLQAAIGLAQIERIEQHVQKKREMGRLYNELLKNISWIQTPLAKIEYAENIYWVYGIVLHDFLNVDNDEIMSKLRARNIGTRPFFWPMHEQPVLKRMGLFMNESYPIAERIARKGFYLPSGLTLTNDNIEYIVNSLKEVLLEYI
ncbi:MAG: DegT/DnrJ/EryC1/StrS family aminotransferase [Ignavibacteriales bacterium]|nr:DegT/DnrJ/EryC1/StrS family aminotransferase [Ignavibacteriales bacterium]